MNFFLFFSEQNLHSISDGTGGKQEARLLLQGSKGVLYSGNELLPASSHFTQLVIGNQEPTGICVHLFILHSFIQPLYTYIKY